MAPFAWIQTARSGSALATEVRSRYGSALSLLAMEVRSRYSLRKCVSLDAHTRRSAHTRRARARDGARARCERIISLRTTVPADGRRLPASPETRVQASLPSTIASNTQCHPSGGKRYRIRTVEFGRDLRVVALSSAGCAHFLRSRQRRPHADGQGSQGSGAAPFRAAFPPALYKGIKGVAARREEGRAAGNGRHGRAFSSPTAASTDSSGARAWFNHVSAQNRWDSPARGGALGANPG
jgi:hypothetical protein